jgi:hypothetical protein
VRVQTFIKKGSGKILEDALIVKPPVFGVFDGATGLDEFANNKGLTGGYLAASLAKKIFANSKMTLAKSAVSLNNKLRITMQKEGININEKFRRWALALAAIKIYDKYFEWIQITDCSILVIYKTGKCRLLVENYEIDRDLLLLWQKYSMLKIKDIFTIIKPIIREKRNDANKKYGLIDGGLKMEKFLRLGKVNLEGIKHVILFTDGFLPPKKDPRKKDDFSNFVRLFEKGGLKLVAKTHWQIQSADPWGWKYIRLKKHDDMAAIALSF